VKKVIASAVALIAVFFGGMAARAAFGGPALVGPPLIDRANATIQLAGSLRSTNCVGVGSVPYVTFVGSFKGGETQLLPDPTPLPLSGNLVVSKILWTINLKTRRGVLTASVSLSSAASGAAYSGAMTLVTQGLPAAGALVPGRGWIVATLPGSPSPGSLLANVEFELSPTSAIGQFGDVPGSLGIPDYSAVFNHDVC
jgi:hypothetical protein